MSEYSRQAAVPASTGNGRALLAGAIHRFVDAFTSAVDDLRQVPLPSAMIVNARNGSSKQ